MSAIVEATRPGPCFACARGIRPGQLIRVNDRPDEGGYAGEWEHVSCPPEPQVCHECFLEVAANGACGCES